MKKVASLLSCLSFLLSCATVVSSTSLYQESRMDNLPPLKHGELESGDLNIGSILISKSTFDDVAKKFGKTEIFTSGKEHAPRQACYRSSQKDDDTILLFESGAMGGWKRVTTISITNSKIWKQTKRCATSTLVTSKIATESGLRIGLSADDITKRFGKPTISSKGFAGYYLSAQKGDWIYTSIFESALVNQRIVSITIHQIVTN